MLYKRIYQVVQYLKMLSVVLAREYEEGGLKQRAMSLVYISLLSLAPLLAVSFSILKGFGVHNQIEPLLFELLEPLGEKGAEITTNIIFFVENIKVGVLGFLGFLMLFYTAISLLSEIEDCFNHIWRVTRPRSLYRRFTDYLSVILIGPVFLFSAVGITASMGNSAVVKGLIQMEPLGTVYYTLGLILPYILIVTAFGFAYVFIPNSKVKLAPALIGGLVAGLAWKSTGMLFARFVAGSAHYSAIYSGFAVVLLAMIWLYISWLILLMGSVIVFHIQYPRYLRYTKRRPHLSFHCQEKLAILLMAQIGQQQIKRGEACNLKHLADTVNVPWEAVADILLGLEQSGLLRTLGDDSRYVLAHDTDAILLRDIVNAVGVAGDQPNINSMRIEASSAMQNLFQELAQHHVNFLQDRSLRDILLDQKSDMGT